MVRLSVFAIVAAVISSATAASVTRACQCLFSDGSHCCVTLLDAPCNVECQNVGRDGTKCNSGGKNAEISWFTGVGRTKCDSYN
ncbi:hypothetical protein FVEN_g2156 [Fusarium venenatum]|uniref:Extracellular membrane protein CFEM domain-containing protein n=1 Tax=Fusarium venenatum TaxID=56646 RepID=A0A2L2T793_9HYPO|nr:uncharacterized protein FVRRES_12569 [Fusarium venenatum]KAG8360325.1 hypothetical protein FVEN_g2156 [Fusarium venenatum]KAH6979178.1 hypothetical protein EDB82DRAFT_507195 [Fusarium venenatum]CEI39878.1 unnamed protein product [Fusarium venenatum]